MKKYRLLILILALLCSSQSVAYTERALNLGFTNFFDGLPPFNGPGWYFRGYYSYYTTNRFTDNKGNTIGTFKFNPQAFIPSIIYMSNLKILQANFGLYFLAPYVITLDAEEPNPLGLTASGAGFDDILIGPFLQWGIIMLHGNRPLMANRLECDFYFPVGDYDTKYSLNPGFNFYSIEPYWAATVFMTPNWTTSWRLYFVTNTMNPSTGVTAGNLIHINFSTEFAIIPRHLAIGVGGYYLRQIQDSTYYGARIPQSKEQVFGLGPGIAGIFSKKTILILNTYFESNARNRPEGTRFVASFVQYL